YSCSHPIVVITRDTPESVPKMRRMRMACSLIASTDRSSGVFLSSASPVHEAKAVGMHSVASPPVFRRKAGLVGSQAVYPRASYVSRSPPDGKLLASGSP